MNAGGGPIHAMRRWFADGAFRSIMRNASYLGSSKIVAALLGLLALACAGRGMSLAQFGVLAVVVAYAQGVSDLAKFQTWQFIVRYGTPALADKDIDRFRDVTGLSLGLDLASGAVAFVGGVALLPLLAHAVGIAPEDVWLALFYCTLIPSMTAATPTGILRTFDRFDLIAIQQLATPLLRAIGAVIAYWQGLGFAGFIVTWYVSRVIGDLSIWAFCIRELRRQGIRHALRPGLLAPARRVKGAWDFVWTTNFAHSIWSAWGPGSNVVVGVMLGPAGAGLFKIAATFFESAGKPANLMAKSFYPEIMRLDPASRQPWRLAVRSGIIAGGVGVLVTVLVILVGEPVIVAAFGARYTDAFTLLEIMAGALVISMVAFPLESLLYMATKQRAALVAEALAAALYGLLLIALIHYVGLIGAAIAYVGGQCMKALFSLIPVLSAWRHRSSLSYRTPQDAPP